MANEEEPQQKLIITDSSKIYEDMSPYYLKDTFSDIQIILYPIKQFMRTKYKFSIRLRKRSTSEQSFNFQIVLAARCKDFEILLMQDRKQVSKYLWESYQLHSRTVFLLHIFSKHGRKGNFVLNNS